MIFLRRWKLIVCMLLVFASGAVVGGAITLRGVKKYIDRRLDSTQWTPRTMDWLEHELKLSDEQLKTAKPVVERAVGEMTALGKSAEEERRGIIGRMIYEISDDLTNEQRKHLQSLIAKHKELQASTGKN